jgi:hypothetical protein
VYGSFLLYCHYSIFDNFLFLSGFFIFSLRKELAAMFHSIQKSKSIRLTILLILLIILIPILLQASGIITFIFTEKNLSHPYVSFHAYNTMDGIDCTYFGVKPSWSDLKWRIFELYCATPTFLEF